MLLNLWHGYFQINLSYPGKLEDIINRECLSCTPPTEQHSSTVQHITESQLLTHLRIMRIQNSKLKQRKTPELHRIAQYATLPLHNYTIYSTSQTHGTKQTQLGITRTSSVQVLAPSLLCYWENTFPLESNLQAKRSSVMCTASVKEVAESSANAVAVLLPGAEQ